MHAQGTGEEETSGNGQPRRQRRYNQTFIMDSNDDVNSIGANGGDKSFSNFLAERHSMTPMLSTTRTPATVNFDVFGKMGADDNVPLAPNGSGPKSENTHQPGRPSLSTFIWGDRRVYHQRKWILILSRDPTVIGHEASRSLRQPKTSTAGKKGGSRRKRMTTGSTLRTIGEQTILSNQQQLSTEEMDVKAWPAFSHYKHSLASLNAQKTRMMKSIMPGGSQPSRSPPLLTKKKMVGTTVMFYPQTGKQAVSRVPPTFSNIMTNSKVTVDVKKSTSTQKDPLCTLLSKIALF